MLIAPVDATLRFRVPEAAYATASLLRRRMLKAVQYLVCDCIRGLVCVLIALS